VAILTLSTLPLSQKLAFAWLALLVLVAALAPVVPLPYAPSTPDLAHIAQAPFGPGRHWLGTDPQGRDVLSVLIFGTRTAVLLTLPTAVLSAILGALAGGAAGFWGNTLRLEASYWLVAAGIIWWALALPLSVAGLVVAGLGIVLALAARGRHDYLPAWPIPIGSVVMGAATTIDTVPRLVLVVAIAAGTGISTMGLLILLIITAWAHPARLVRAQMLRVRTLPFIEGCRAAGLPDGRIWLRHAMPLAIQPLRTALPLSVAGLLGLESTLSFLGIGLPPDVASWGRLLGTIREEPSAWWTFTFPAILLTTTILSLNRLSRERL
jgi:peptide/nickel transport system permease protein